MWESGRLSSARSAHGLFLNRAIYEQLSIDSYLSIVISTVLDASISQRPSFAPVTIGKRLSGVETLSHMSQAFD